ncbi:hypothetical protein SAMN04488038_102224 [Solimonas aquatica]|uniref:Uncharacterized protein n=1 Tax=Solimonas aquatica TaxID=489703 RepID=A0A1H9BV08_9GAMM|nr:hypothetical protein [Solimonas aquatica]SEP92383.1 hypothetical protein SAMN04488038_102224 [Solimonas aquatica]
MSQQNAGAQAARPKTVPLHAATQAVPFPAGVYRFSVRTASPVVEGTAATPFPALLVAAAPLTPPGAVEFVGNTAAVAAWLCNVGDIVVAKIGAKGATLILSSLRTAADTQAFDIKVEQINDSTSPALPSTAAGATLKLRVALHLRGQGEARFTESEWAGRAGSGAWIEAMSVVPLEALSAADIECKGLAANGFETPWLSDGAVCGTKGGGVPLIGFALRLKPAASAEYDCEYSAYFRSGITVGPLRNGVPCRSRTNGDPLEAVQIRIVKRTAAAEKPAAVAGKTAAPAAKKGPSFGKFRDEEAAPAVPAKKAAKKIGKSVAPAKAGKSVAKPAAAKAPAKKNGKAVKPAAKRK